MRGNVFQGPRLKRLFRVTRAVFSSCVVFGGPGVLWVAERARVSRGFAYRMPRAFDDGAVFARFDGRCGVAAEFRFSRETGLESWRTHEVHAAWQGRRVFLSCARAQRQESVRCRAWRHGALAQKAMHRAHLALVPHAFRGGAWLRGRSLLQRLRLCVRVATLVVLLEGCTEMSSGVIRTGVCRSRIRDSFVPAGRKLRGFSFESSSNLLDKRGNHGRFAELQL